MEMDSRGSPAPAGLDVVIAHDFTETYGGAERIIAAAAAVLPDAPFWSIAGRPEVAERMGVGDRAHTVLPESELLFRHYRALAPVYQGVVRARRLPEADVLLTSSYAFAHGFRTRNRAPQVCFCYSPLRFLWSMTGDYAERVARGPVRRGAFNLMVGGMRRADRAAARRVTRYVSESRYVAEVVKQAYGRESDVVYPPVDCTRFHPPESPGHEDFFLFSGRLVEPYKRPGIVIEAFRSMPGKRLVVAGDGPAYAELKARATPNIEFLGHVGDEQLIPLMQRCAANVFPSVDDFGLIPVETAACGRPMIAFAGGGALETVVAGKTGEFFDRPTAEGVREAVEAFDPGAYDPAAIRAHAEAWDVPRFQAEILRAVEETASAGPGGR
jgi:glycosyltransferase involved in cell wall biosynthesis